MGWAPLIRARSKAQQTVGSVGGDQSNTNMDRKTKEKKK
jgi:hypothetical protein